MAILFSEGTVPRGLLEILGSWIPAAVALPILVFGLFLARNFLERWLGRARGVRMRIQITMLLLTGLGTLVILVLLPLDAARRHDLLSLFGIVLTAAIALSSTTFLANVMGGLTLRAMRNHQIGDFLRCGEHFGRVTERGLVHTEIQTEDRDLTTIPNLYLITNPMTVIHASGTVVSATVTLGYEIPRRVAQEGLMAAAAKAGLKDPFVQVSDLGDFSVKYRAAGLLEEVKQVISARSRLRECMLDELHARNLEIVSPTFMNTRAFDKDARFIPQAPREEPSEPQSTRPEDAVFDKADAAESLERMEEALVELMTKQDELKKTEGGKEEGARLDRRIERLRARLDQKREDLGD